MRLGAIQESFTTLTRFKEELAKSQAELVPLQAPAFGIEPLIREVQAIRDVLANTLGEIEASGEDGLGSRVEELSQSKREIDSRIAHVFEHFTELESIRKDISGTFMAIRSALMKIG